ncbi:MAG: hypothetical protein NTZ63_03255 [Candidatus Omnitrophica bacterium]|nr:hypothetical protein [Candidatus Omnitrophota bacterium]
MNRKTIFVLLLFVVAFLNGLIQNWNGSGFLVWVICSILIIAILGGSNILKKIKESAGTRKILIAILIALVLIPLVFLGTCLLAVGGSSLRSLFVPMR